MRSGCRQWTWLALFALLALAPCAWPQLQVGENTTLNLNGTASLGYNSVFDGNDMSSLAWGFAGNLSGDYYDSRFLNFQISPYLNQSRLNSNYSSSFNTSGVTAVANFLSNSRTPVQFSYERDHNSEGTFNVGGSGSYRAVGDGQGFSLGAAYLPEDWPTLQANYSHSGSSYEVIGNPGGGTSHSNAFSLSSGYELWGANLSASYNKAYMNSENPVFGEPGVRLKQDTNQDNFQFSAARRLFDSSNLSFSFGRSHLNANYQGTRTDATYNTLSALMGMQPVARLGFNFHVNYSSNLSAQYLSTILTGAAGALANKAESPNVSFTSNYLNYGMTAAYNIARNLTATGNINRQVQGQRNGLPDATNTTMNLGVTWSHALLGGSFGTHYSIAHSFAPVYSVAGGQRESSFTGQSTAASYSRQLLGWSGSTSFSYARSLTSVLVGYVQTTYGGNGSVSRNLGRWGLALSGSYSKARIESLNLSDSRTTNYSASLSHGNFGFSGSYSRSSGSGLQVGNSIVPTPAPGPLPNYFVLFGGEAYGIGTNYRPLRRWTINSSYSHVRYHTINLSSSSNNTSDQFYIRSQYRFRQMYFNAGYSHLSQGFGFGLVKPAAIDTVYFGVSRRFDFF